MGCINALIGAILPRFVLLVGWSNDQAYWGSLFGSELWLGLGFLVMPWTTLVYGLGQPNGMTPLNWLFLLMAGIADLGTWGIGIFGSRKEVSSYRS